MKEAPRRSDEDISARSERLSLLSDDSDASLYVNNSKFYKAVLSDSSDEEFVENTEKIRERSFDTTLIENSFVDF